MKSESPRNSFGRIFGAIIAAVATVALLGSGLISGPAAAADTEEPLPTPPPFLQRDDDVVTGDPLPTVQIDDGFVWAQEVIGTTVYAVGRFDNAREPLADPGTSLTPRTNILAFDINSGDLLPFEPTVNGEIKSIAASPDGSRIYIGGSFNTVNGQTRWNIAALDAQTGELVPGFNASIGGSGVYALSVDEDTLYVGGGFTQANGTARENLAAFATSNGALRMNWDSQPDRQVDAMTLDPDGAHVIVAGRFGNVDGDGTWRGMVSINASTGDVNSTWQGTQKVKNGWSTGANRGRAGIFALAADDSGVYGTGWVFASAAIGNLEGVFKLEPTSGETEWLFDCLGDNYGVHSTGRVVYTTTHTHACSTMGLYPEQSPRKHTFIHAMTADVRGTLGPQPHEGATYVNWEGENAPSVYAWYPDFFTGTATGLGQAGLSITGAGNIISVAGEFPGVNNRHFQGIVRFSTSPPDGAQDGPRTTTDTWGAPAVNASIPGRISVSIDGTWDRDDLDLTYELTRQGSEEALDSEVRSHSWWDAQDVRLTDAHVEAGQSYTYRITVKDGDGNEVVSRPVTATASSEEALEYSSTVLDDGATLYYPLGDVRDDWAGSNQPDFGNGVSAQQPSQIQGSGTGYSTFTGNSSGRVSSSVQEAAPTEFSAELWFNTSSGSGGKLMGFGSSRTGSSGSYDRHIYMHNNGQLSFGVYPNATRVVTSESSYNDGQWHHVVATLSEEGMKLYVDGEEVAADPDTTVGQAFNGYWRVGGDNLSGWPNSPSSNWFSGAIDEVAVYPRALDEAQISTHYAIGAGYQAPTADFTVNEDALTVEVDGSGSTAGADGNLEEYVWDFGDGSPVHTGTSPTAVHTYEEDGTYQVSLTVRDNRGLVNTTMQSVSVVGENIEPTAVFESNVSGLTVTVDGTGSTDEDGTIESYQWDWGDGSEAGSGPLASHTYSESGIYSVTLTVTDDRGDSADATEEIEVSHADPIPIFEATTEGLTVSTDASGSTASDGATLTYSWDWGDGTEPSTGEQATHTYLSQGTFDITLTATDSLGASATYSQTVSVDPTEYAARDEFERVVSAGWGEALTGGIWTPQRGSASVASTDGTHGLLALAPGQTRQMALEGLSLENTDSELSYRMDYGPSNGASYIGMTLRDTGSSQYRVQAWHRDNGTVWLVAQHGSTVITSQRVAGITWEEGDQFTLRTEVTGTDPTTVNAKIWHTTDSEPETWQLTATDSTPELQLPGYASVRYYVTGNAADIGQVAFDRITILDLGEDEENVAPAAGFSVSADGLSVSVDAGESEDSDGTIAAYEWDWGDGSDPGVGETATHTYAEPGEYTITLTVTDDQGATDTSEETVTVEEPDEENVAPAAGFSVSADGLSVSVDAGESEDSDGTIASYEWDWGDGSDPGVGETATHTYAEPGEYTITLTVTDDQGATDTSEETVTVEEPDEEEQPGGDFIRDDFDREQTASWGEADIGGAWTVTGGYASAASVEDSQAQFALPAGSSRTAMLNEAQIHEYAAEVEFSVEAEPGSGATYADVVARNTGAGRYLVRTWLRQDGSVWLVAQKDSTVLLTSRVADLMPASGDSLILRMEVSGTEATQIRAKLWSSDSAEPTGWHLAFDDDSPEMQAPGSFGLRASRSGASTESAVISFSQLWVGEVE